MESGIPQRSLLGPALFNVYTNNLFLVNCNGEIVSFTDDTTVFVEEDDWYNLKIKAEPNFKIIKK